MKAIGIDIGTTTVSGVVLDLADKVVLESRTISNGSFLKTENEWERIQDADELVKKAQDMLDGFLIDHPDAASIGLTGQMHGIVYTDRKGRALSPLFTWQDGRGNLVFADGETLTQLVKRKTGISVYTGYGLVTHLYQLRTGQAPADAVTVCTIADYFGMRLTGRSRPLVHAGNAASLGFFDVQKGCYDRGALESLGVDTGILPEVTNRFACLGVYRGIPVAVALGDNQASFLGSVGYSENTALLNMGTGGQISMLSRHFFEGDGIEARPFSEGWYLLAGSSLCGGRAYAILEKFMRECAEAVLREMPELGKKELPQQYDVLEKLAESGLKQANRMSVRTTFHGTRINPALRGSVENIGEDNFTPQGLASGVLEGMARELFDLYQVLRRETGVRAERLVASGNGLRRNPVLQGICSRMFEAELVLAPFQEEAACGAAVNSGNCPKI